MSVFPFLHIFNTIACLYLAVYIFIKNPKALVNRVCFAFLLCFAVWSFPLVFLHNPYVSKNTARLANNISAFGWCSFSSWYLWLMLAYSGKKEILKKKWFYLLLFGIPLVFIYKQWTGFLLIDFNMHYYGWKPLWSKTIWPHLFYVYYLSFMAVGFYINIDFMRKAPNKILKKQAAIIFVSLVIALILGTITDVILPLLNIHVIPNISNIFALIWTFGAAYVMARYKFLTITPATAAENIISTMYDCLVLLSMKGEIVTVNKATSDMLGYKEDELKGKPVSILFKEDGLTDDLFKNTARGGDLKNKDLLFKTREGNEIPMLFSDSILRDEAGNAAGIVCVAKDISERKKLEEEIFKGKKLESIGLLAGGIAHDFNNLLAVIMGNLSLLEDEISPGKKSFQFLVKALETSSKAAALARKFITLSPGRWLKKEKVNLSHLLPIAQKSVQKKQVFDMMSEHGKTIRCARGLGCHPILKKVEDSELPKAGINVFYNIEIPGDLMPIYGDEEQLYQVIQNLFLNASAAIEALPGEERGKISVRAENITVEDVSDGKDTSILLKKGKYVKVVIEDNGVGIPTGNIEKVFDPYFSTQNKTDQKGMGLGLTLCYSIIKKHDGHIAVESQRGKGTAVTLYLPAFFESSPESGGRLNV